MIQKRKNPASPFDDLRHGAPFRLALYRKQAQSRLELVAKVHGTESTLYRDYLAKQWRAQRWVTPHGLGFKAPYGGATRCPQLWGGVLNMDSGALDHLRELPSEDQTRDYGRGWYSDAHDNETITGKVAVLPSRKGERRFLAYIVWSGSDGITVDDRVYDDPITAFRNADRLAERVAEEEREYSVKRNEARELEDENEAAHTEMKTLRQRFAKFARIVRESPKHCPDLREEMVAIRERFAELLEQVIERNAKIAEYTH